MLGKIIDFVRDDEGSNAAEYSLIIALVAAVLVAGATALGTAVSGRLTTAAGMFD